MTKTKQVVAKPVLDEKDFAFVINMAIGGGLQNPETTEEEKKRFTELSGKKVSVADSLNIALTASQFLVQQAMEDIHTMVTHTMDTANVLVTAIKNKEILTAEEFEEAQKSYYETLTQIQNEMLEAQKEDEIELEPDTKGMTVVRNDSDVDLSVKG